MTWERYDSRELYIAFNEINGINQILYFLNINQFIYKAVVICHAKYEY